MREEFRKKTSRGVEFKKNAFLSNRFRSAAMLAGGASRRMGEIDKQFLDMAGKPLSLHIVDNLRRLFPEITVVSRRPELYTDFNGSIRVVPDFLPGFGPLSGLHAALSSSGEEWVYLTACDMPNFSSEWAQYLIHQVKAAEKIGIYPLACMTSYKEHIEPFHALYSRKLLPVIEQWLNDGGTFIRALSLNRLIRTVSHICIQEEKARLFSPDWSLFININTLSDWNEYLNRASNEEREDYGKGSTTRIYIDAISADLSRS